MFTFITPVRPLASPRVWKDFSAAPIAAARLEITGLGLYRAFLNGRRVGRDYLTPGFNDYDAYLRYQTYDVTALLQKENRLEVYLGNGWYKGRIGFGEKQTERWGSDYLLAARLILTDEKGRETVLETDETWLAAASPIGENSIYDGEARDDARPAGEETPCRVVKTAYRPEPQFSPPIRARAELKPTLLHTPKGEQVLDFGQNLVGVLRFVNRLPWGGQMRIQTGEVLQEGCFYRDNLRSARSEYRYVSDGVEKEVEPYFTFFGFRYAKVEGLAQVNPEDFTAVALCSDLPETLDCETGNPLINQLMRNALWGQRGNFLDVPTDCPQRDERLGWTADTQVFVNTACYQMDCKDFYRKFMRDMREDQVRYYEGNIPAVSPSLKHAIGDGGAVWADAATIIPWNVYQNYGDLALLRENYPMMRDYANVLIELDKKAGGTHLRFPYHTFGDWLAQDGLTPQSGYGGTPHAYIQGVYYLLSLRLTAKAARALGEEEDAARFSSLAEEIHRALLDEYVSPNGNLTADTQTAYTLALLHGLYRDKEKLIAGFRDRLRRDFYRIKCGFTGAPLLLPVLMDNGMEEIAFRILMRETFPGWLYCVKLGATTIWERWNSLDENGKITGTDMNSFNHYAFGSVCEAIYSRIAGLRLTAPGWTAARIAPHLDGRLGHVSLRFASPAGEWRVRWQLLENGEATLTATVPAGARAEILLPDHPEGFTASVGEGTHAYTWRPTRDYLHPFSESSLILDVLANAEAAGILAQAAPEIYQKVTQPETEWPLSTLGQALSRLEEAPRAALLARMRQVRA